MNSQTDSLILVDKESNKDYQCIACYLCGATIVPNVANLCSNCIRAQYDISSNIPREYILYQCRRCLKYMTNSTNYNTWISASPESKELLSLCLSKVPSLDSKNSNKTKVKLVEAVFIFTESHSKRIKLKLTISKEVMGLELQSSFTIIFLVNNKQCLDCAKYYRIATTQGGSIRSKSSDRGKVILQIRQNTSKKSSLLNLENTLAGNNNIKKYIIKVTSTTSGNSSGLDLHLNDKSSAIHILEFLSKSFLMKINNYNKKLIGADTSSNTVDNEFNQLIEICPINKHDLVFLPKSVINNGVLAGTCPLVLVLKVAGQLHFIETNNSLRTITLDSNQYWRYKFNSLLTADSMSKFIVLNIDKIEEKSNINSNALADDQTSRYALAEAQISRYDALGSSEIYTVYTHLGNIIHTGDIVEGYDLLNTNINNEEFTTYRNSKLVPDVILVRKHYEERKKKRKRKQTNNQEDVEMKDIDIDDDDDNNMEIE